jgi:hypothetical protein
MKIIVEKRNAKGIKPTNIIDAVIYSDPIYNITSQWYFQKIKVIKNETEVASS